MTHPATTLLPNPPVGERIPDRAVQFLDLVDDVLVSVGRQRLDRTGTQPDIIRVQPEDRVLQILAGPGSGKTEMLVWRVLFELVVHQTPAEQVLVTTFTRKAATELEVRLVERSDLLLQAARARGLSLPDPHMHDVLVGTLHSLCDRLLREFDPEYMAAGTELLDEHESLVRLAREYRFRLGFEGRGGSAPGW